MIDKVSERLSGYVKHIDSYSLALDVAQASRDAAALEQRVERYKDACRLVSEIVIDGYDAGDEPLNKAWDACVEALAEEEE